MKILVCIKQVLEMDGQFILDHETQWVKKNENSSFCINRFDEYALEEAFLIKDQYKNTIVDVVSLGPSRVTDAIVRGISLGADNGIHINCSMEGLLLPHFTAKKLAKFIKQSNYDLIMTGVMAEDDMYCLVGPMIASILKIPCGVAVVDSTLNHEKNEITITSELGKGFLQKSRMDLPALITVQSSGHTPRYPSLSNMLRAKKTKLETIDIQEFNLDHPQNVKQKICLPQKSDRICFIEGEIKDQAKKLLSVLKENGFLNQ